jgi:hypothetical protein
MTFRLLTGQFTHRSLRLLRSFLNRHGINFLCSDHRLRAAEKALELPLHVHSSDPFAVRLADVTTPLTRMLAHLYGLQQLAPYPMGKVSLWLQLQLDRGSHACARCCASTQAWATVLVSIFKCFKHCAACIVLIFPHLSRLAGFAGNASSPSLGKKLRMSPAIYNYP